jgi:hypothetical protein
MTPRPMNKDDAMNTRMTMALGGAILLLAGSHASAGTITPNLPGPVLDPCGPGLCRQEHPKLCRTVTVHECMDYQGNPPHCTRFQDSTREVCS